MVSLETIGYYNNEPGGQRYPPLFKCFCPGRGNFIRFISNLRSRSAMRRAVRAFRAGSAFPIESAATFS